MKAKDKISCFSLEFYYHIDEATKKSILYIVIVMVLMIIYLRYLEYTYDGTNLWKDWQPDLEITTLTPNYTEQRNVNNLFRTEVNTWSNMFYVLIGIYTICLSYQDYLYNQNNKKSVGGYFPSSLINQVMGNSSTPTTMSSNFLIRNPQFSFYFGIACIHLGIGSGLFHASLTTFGRQLDVASMYSPIMVCNAISICRWYPRINLTSLLNGGNNGHNSVPPSQQITIPAWPVHFVFIFFAALIFFAFKWQMDVYLGSGIILPVLIFSAYTLTIIDRIYYPHRSMELRYLIMSFVILLVGLACRITDVKKAFSTPTSYFQGHSFWHLFTALAIYYIYVHQRSEPYNNSDV